MKSESYKPFPHQSIAASPLLPHACELETAFARAWGKVTAHGNLPRWQQALDLLPALPVIAVHIDQPTIQIETKPVNADQHTALIEALRQLIPWRKGPFQLAEVTIDTEWRSDLKWDRISPHIAPLTDRTVLDIGCGSGYHCWRMRGAGAKLVLGIDPSALYAMQFQSIQHYIQEPQVQMWPLGIDDLPPVMACFDTVFSMGLLYHRKSPIAHLQQLLSLLRPGGELVLETLVIEGDAQTCLIPQGRYAKMRNVWFIPSSAMLLRWLERCGAKRIRMVDCTATTTDEQRATEWMHFESLKDFLDPNDPTRTIEGYPAPKRATILAER
ncbi:MAG: tRNA 5-methoxyuridine(34)/uridine 5-oxyacetic acid(34) synthase CmoB [Mariprofundales bacterium]|nr:tRNA 5-methoxyuridine(34)/uridine 5-oxyacetic acid(34) synthase CmoB [Mariprofundales bacterium]